MQPPASDNKPGFARKLGRRLCELLCLLLVGSLALQYFLWWCLRHDRQLALPEFIAELVQQRVEKAGVACRFREIVFSPNGYLEINGVELGAPGAKEPTFVVKRAVVTLSVPWLLRGRVVLNRALLDGGGFYCPASMSPDGRRRVVLGDIRALIDRKEGEGVRARALQAHYGVMPIVIHGEFLPRALWDSASSGKSGVVTPEEWEAIHKVAGKMLRAREEIESIGKISLEVRGRGEASGAVAFSVRAKGESFDLPLPGRARVTGVRFHGRARFDGVEFLPEGEAALSLGAFEWDYDGADGGTLPALSVKTGPARLVSRLGTKWQPPVSARVAVTDVVVNGEQTDFLDADANWGALPEISAKALLVRGGDFVDARGTGNLTARSGRVDFAVRLAPAPYFAHPRIKPFLGKLPAPLELPQHLALDGFADFAPGGKWTRSRFFFDTGAARFGAINIVGGKGDIHLTPDGIALENADLRAVNYGAKGSFRTGFAKGAEFRFLLEGSIHPGVLDFIGPFWVDLWRQFNLRPDSLPRADIEIRGDWGVPHEFIYCGAAGERIAFRGAEFDHASLRIFETPQSVSLFNMRARQGVFNAFGGIQLHYSLIPRHRLRDIRFHFDGWLPKDTGVLLAGGKLPQMLAPLRVPAPVKATVTGCVHAAASPTPERAQVLVRAKTGGAFTAWNLPLADFQGAVAYDTGRLVVTVDDAVFAGGKIGRKRAPWSSARPDRPQRVWLDLRPADPVLQFDLEVLRARRSAFLENLKKLNPAPAASSVPAAPPAPAGATPPTPPAPDNSALDVALTGSVTLPKLETLDASGSANLSDDELAQLHVFGGLSRVLDKLSIGFSSFKLNRAESDFTIREKVIYFPNVKITGDNARIDSVGRFHLDGNLLNFRAQLVAKSGEGIPIPGVKYVFRGLNKWTQLIPVNITGTLENPTWNLDITPSALFSSPLDVKEGTAPEKEPPPAPAPQR